MEMNPFASLHKLVGGGQQKPGVIDQNLKKLIFRRLCCEKSTLLFPSLHYLFLYVLTSLSRKDSGLDQIKFFVFIHPPLIIAPLVHFAVKSMADEGVDLGAFFRSGTFASHIDERLYLGGLQSVSRSFLHKARNNEYTRQSTQV